MEKRHPPIEREFGVPFPGEILGSEKWTHTALKRLPSEGRLDWKQVFGRQGPVVLDLGCGNGRFLIGSALGRPDHDHLGLDLLPVVIRYATRRANQRGLANIRFAVGEARDFLHRLVEPHSVAEVHLYNPQPYDDVADIHRRLVTPEFLVLVHRALVPGGLLVVQTDHAGYWGYMLRIIPTLFKFEERHEPWPDAPKGRTRREIIDIQRGLPVYRGQGRARLGLSDADARRLAATLPPPLYSAEPKLRALDRLDT